MSSIGRNDLCWCGSGLKYKRCHLDREQGERVQFWETQSLFKKHYGKKYCSAPIDDHANCDGGIIRSHTVPKSSSLSKIAREGHVYSVIPSMDNLNKNFGTFKPELLGVNRASTFTGFCGFHDNSIFAPLEKRKFEATPEQCFLLSYRAIARECFTKNGANSAFAEMKQLDRGLRIEQQIDFQNIIGAYGIGVGTGLDNISKHKRVYDVALKDRNFTSVKAFVLKFTDPPDVMCSGGLFPEMDFDGNHLQDLAQIETPMNLITYSSFCDGSNGYFVFSWLADSDISCLPFIASLESKSNSQLSNYLVRFLFEYCENVHMKPDWWEALGQMRQEALTTRLSILANIFQPRDTNPMKSDGLYYASWTIEERRKIGF